MRENVKFRTMNWYYTAHGFLFVTVFVVTAADPKESSYACYFDNTRETYLGDVFSVMWMQDSEEV